MVRTKEYVREYVMPNFRAMCRNISKFFHDITGGLGF